MIKAGIVLLLFTATLPAFAQGSSYDKGLAAFAARDFETTIVELTPYADQGDCFAEYAVGFAYWYTKGDPKSDSIAEHYLRLAAQQKQTHAMGILATMLAIKAMHDPDLRPEALAWAELAAAYDPIQASTTTRAMIRQYLEAFEISRGEQMTAEMKKIFDNMEPCSSNTQQAREKKQ